MWVCILLIVVAAAISAIFTWWIMQRRQLAMHEIAEAIDAFNMLVLNLSTTQLNKLKSNVVKGKYYTYTASTQTNLRGELTVRVHFKFGLAPILIKSRGISKFTREEGETYIICVVRGHRFE